MRKKAKGPLDKYKNWIGMGLVIVIFVVVLLIAGKPSQPKSKTSTRKSSSERVRREKGTSKRKRRSKEERLARKARRKLERERRREERRKRTSDRTDRSARSGRSSRELRTSSRRQTGSGYTLKGIFTDENGVKYALIGDRRARSGDVVAGRRIRDVQTDRVSVEYGGTNYEVRIGNSLF